MRVYPCKDCKPECEEYKTCEYKNTLDLGATISDYNHDISLGNFNKTPILELRANGDILVKGKLIENDIEVVHALRELLNII